MSDHATVPSLPRTRRSARLQAVEADLQVQNQIIGSNVNLDRLTILPPEILIMIWDRLFIEHGPGVNIDPNHFFPLHSRLLYVQRTNLYRHVFLNDTLNVSDFATSLQENESLGGFVKRLTITEETELDEGSSLSNTLESITSRIRRCTSLSAPPEITTLLYQIDTPYAPFLSQLVHLTLTFYSHDLRRYSILISLSPRLKRLVINPPIPSGHIVAAPTVVQRPVSYHRLEHLTIKGHDFRHANLRGLLCAVSAVRIILRGNGVGSGLQAMRNPSLAVTVRVTERDYTVVASLDSALLRFNKMKVLDLGGNIRVTDGFYATLAQTCPRLRKLCFGPKFKLNATALLQAIPLFPSSFREFILSHVDIRKHGLPFREYWGPPRWPVGCEPEDVLSLIGAAEGHGFEVLGSAVEALLFEMGS